jgi:3-oxoacyl-[acyl-carrier protein] reductase
MNRLDLNGRHAIVTGGAAGLGLAISQRFLASGAELTWWDRDAAAMEAARQQLGAQARRVNAVVVDVGEHASVVEAVRQTLGWRADIDALVNCAGITGPNVKLWDYPPEQWLQVMQVNLNGLFYCCREVAPLMRARNAGHIVNIASVAGKDGNPNASA